MKIIYIAGPYIGDGTRESVEKNIREAEKYQLALANKKIGFFCSHNHTEHFTTGKGCTSSEDFFYELDFYFLKNIADAVLALPGWEKSNGAKKEVEWAIGNDIPVFYPEHPEDIEKIIIWYNEF